MSDNENSAVTDSLDSNNTNCHKFAIGAGVLASVLACAISTGVIADRITGVDPAVLPTRVVLPTDVTNNTSATNITIPTRIPETLEGYVKPTEEQIHFEQIINIRPETYNQSYNIYDLTYLVNHINVFTEMPRSFYFLDLQVTVFRDTKNFDNDNLTEIHIKYKDDMYLLFTTLPSIADWKSPETNIVDIPMILDLYGTEGTDYKSFLDILPVWSNYLDTEN